MGSDSFKEEYQKLTKDLGLILNSQQIVPELQNEGVVRQLLKSIKICEFLEDKLDVSQSERKSLGYLTIISKYYAISNIHTDPYYFIDEATLVDDVNYLQVFSKNVLKTDIDDLNKRNNSYTATSNSEQVKQGVFDRNSYSEDVHHQNNAQQDNTQYDYFNQQPINNGFSSLFNGNSLYGLNGFGNNPGLSYEDSLAAQAANARITTEALTGKIYIYKSKPKFIPILKYVIGSFIIFLMIVIIAQLILAGQVSKYQIMPSSALFQFLGLVGQVNVNGTNTTINWYLGTFSNFSGVWTYFSAILWLLIFSYTAYIQLRKPVSDNDKYVMRVGWLLFICIFEILFFILTFADNTLSGLVLSHWALFTNSFSGSELSHILGFRIVTILYITFLCAIAILAIIGWALKPQRDNEYLSSLYQKYFDEARMQLDSMTRR